MNLNEEQLKKVFEVNVFPIYIYWDSAENKVIYLTEKQDNFIGIIYKNPFEEMLATAISPEDVERINNIIMQQGELGEEEKNEIIPKAHLTGDLGLNSLECYELILLLEKEFQITISDEEAEEVQYVSQVYALVGKKLAEKN